MKSFNKLNIWGLLIALLLILSTSVFAQTSQTEYLKAGYNDGNGGFGFFNDEITTDSRLSGSISLSSPNQVPLVADLDNDTINEVIVLDGTSLRLYQPDTSASTFNSVDACSVTSSSTHSNMVIHDIDDDGFLEVIVAIDGGSQPKIEIFGYNGTSCNVENSFSVTATSYIDGQLQIGCGDDDGCIIVYAREDEDTANQFLQAIAFNSTTGGLYNNFQNEADSSTGVCMPHIPVVSYKDVDNDGVEEYIFSYFVFDRAGSPDYAYIRSATINSSLNVIGDDSVQINMGNPYEKGSTANCNSDDISNMISAPLVSELDGASSNGLEVVIALMTSTTQFKMYSYSSDLSSLDDYPETQTADGIIVSNVFLANAFQDTGTEDFCVVGYNSAENWTDILCASEQTGDVPETREYTYETPHNVSSDYMFTIAHASQHSSDLTTIDSDSANLDEIITSHGVVKLTDEIGLLSLIPFGSCQTGGNCLARVLWENDVPNINTNGASVISVDVENIGRDDLIIHTETNVWYYNDGFENTAPVFDYENTCINPDADSTWKVNTSTSIQITADDSDGDKISAKVILYEGTSNEQDSGWTTNYTSGSTITISSLIANVTIGAGNLQLWIRDTEGNNDSIDVPFSVSSVGFELGDAIGCLSVPVDETDLSTDTEGDTYENNTITSGVLNLTDTLGWNIGIKATWLMIMVLGFIAIAVGSFFKGGMSSMTLIITTGLIIMFELFMIILGFFFGIFGWGVLITLFVFAVSIISLLVLRPLLTGGE